MSKSSQLLLQPRLQNDLSRRLLPVGDAAHGADELNEERCGLPMQGPEQIAILLDACENYRKPHRLSVEHRTATVAREAIPARPDDVDVACAQGDAFREDAKALVDQRIE